MHYGTSFTRQSHDGRGTTAEAGRKGSPSSDQDSQERLRALLKRYGINQKTVAKWKKWASVADLPTDLKEANSNVLSLVEQAIIVVFRRHNLAAA